MVIDKGFPAGSDSEESTCNVGDLGSIPGSGKSPGDGNSKPFQYSYLENSMERGAPLFIFILNTYHIIYPIFNVYLLSVCFQVECKFHESLDLIYFVHCLVFDE